MPGDILGLVALEPLPQGDWLRQADEVLRSAGIRTKRKGTTLLSWREIRRSKSITYSNGYLISRLWLGPRRWALAVTGKRLYFKDDGSLLDDRPEHLIVSGNRPTPPDAEKQLVIQRNFATILLNGFGPSSVKPVQLATLDCDLSAARKVWIGQSVRTFPPASLNDVYREIGFDSVPENFTVVVCPLDCVSSVVAEEFARRIERAGNQRHARVMARISNPAEIELRVQALQDSGGSVMRGRCVLFVLPNKDRSPSHDACDLFGSLERAGVPFRRAYSDDPLNYSIPDQLPSLLIAAGGKPHRSLTRMGNQPVWTVGVDLGHHPERSSSVLALTLVDPEGVLVGAWTKEQPRDETARHSVLLHLLMKCVGQLRSFDSSPHVVVLRDGRLFKNESFSVYEEAFRSNFSLFEYRKRGNPQIIKLGRKPSAVLEPIAAMVPGESTMFIVVASPRTQRDLPGVAKVSWRERWNGLGLEPHSLATILAVSATAPGLGLHPRHLPAAIYWADGVAGASDEDLRFRGVPVERLA